MEFDREFFWNETEQEVLDKLKSSKNGLTQEEADLRFTEYSKTILKPKKESKTFKLLISQFSSPINVILIVTSILAFFLGDKVDSIIVLLIIVMSGLLGFWQEFNASSAIQGLLSLVTVKSTVRRDNKKIEIDVDRVIPGDVILLTAGDVVPGDSRILESNDLFVDESSLTGESFPIEKETGVIPKDTGLNKRKNSLFMGTHVISGTATALVIFTGLETEFGKISQRLKLKPPETEFDRGIRKFGYLLMEITLIMTIAIFAVNVFFKRPVLDSFLFSLALAIGLTPQLLPAIISINLSKGVNKMAKQKVIVKQMTSIENFGSMNILCTDKTGTLTEGRMKLGTPVDYLGKESQKINEYAYLNAFFQSGYINPIDEVIKESLKYDTSNFKKLDEIPYDFNRKRLSILVEMNNSSILISKGALASILEICDQVETGDEKLIPIDSVNDDIQKLFSELSGKGYRVLGLAYKDFKGEKLMSKKDESKMIFLGFLSFYDPIKSDTVETIAELSGLGVETKIITGDNKLVAQYIAKQMGIENPRILTGTELRNLSDTSLIHSADQIDIFAEVEPNQKERIIIALKKAGNVVGYMGDGINDVSGLHAADIGISVDSAVDVAKDAAEIVLLEKSLKILANGIKEGRVTFSNTLKYLFINTSASFGNMFSMAGASLFLKFLPLLPSQILLLNFLTDFPAMSIATDSVDSELIEKPRRWNISFLKNFMVVFGLVSTMFDFITFGVLILILKTGAVEFRTGWFILSAMTEILILFIIRTKRFFIRSKPSTILVLLSILAFIITVIIAYIPDISNLLGFTPISFGLMLVLILIALLYVVATSVTKKIFYKYVKE